MNTSDSNEINRTNKILEQENLKNNNTLLNQDVVSSSNKSVIRERDKTDIQVNSSEEYFTVEIQSLTENWEPDKNNNNNSLHEEKQENKTLEEEVRKNFDNENELNPSEANESNETDTTLRQDTIENENDTTSSSETEQIEESIINSQENSREENFAVKIQTFTKDWQATKSNNLQEEKQPNNITVNTSTVFHEEDYQDYEEYLEYISLVNLKQETNTNENSSVIQASNKAEKLTKVYQKYVNANYSNMVNQNESENQ